MIFTVFAAAVIGGIEGGKGTMLRAERRAASQPSGASRGVLNSGDLWQHHPVVADTCPRSPGAQSKHNQVSSRHGR